MSDCTCKAIVGEIGSHETRDPNCGVHGDHAQPLPKASRHPFAHQLAKNILDERRDYGRNKYGRALQPLNGRDPIRDMVEELADGLAYAMCVKYERDWLENFTLDHGYDGLYLTCRMCHWTSDPLLQRTIMPLPELIELARNHEHG